MTLFPDPPRDFPFRRTTRIVLRTVHILAAGVLLGGHIFDQPVAILEPWLWGAVVSGLLIFITDLHASLAILFEVRGLAVVLKIFIVLLVFVFWEHRLTLLLLALVIGAVSSHLPKCYRHKLIFLQQQVIQDQRSG